MAIVDHIERFYNCQWLDQAMGYRSLEEFDQQERGRVIYVSVISGPPQAELPRLSWE